MIPKWTDMKWWQSGENQVVEERLMDIEDAGFFYNPGKKNMYRALLATPLHKTKVAIIGQDPYPNHIYCTGLAFSVPKTIKVFPDTLVNLLKEYKNDLGLPIPASGDLSKWCTEGVLLWNAVPTCNPGKSLSHNWPEYTYLTKEIIEQLDKKSGVVFIFLGGVARGYAKYVNQEVNAVLEASHPSPRASAASRNPFFGSRIFSTANDKLVEWGLGPVDWRLP